ncbi:helix-hairpin-helix domain-containing protein [Curtobacterium sp. PhB130]|uniref:ComEA family DNA-binding protein n=1 Tax=Curtobacterium sp. PhB130 TaxID=2485178 RepID=UPI000F4CA769|nr:helix-hairpin-helix domain-containing protein [Curtobacterium sp. PhB130]
MSRFTLTPRAALVLAAIVVAVALVVIVLGARGGGAGGTVSVDGASAVPADGAPGPGVPASGGPGPGPGGSASASSSAGAVVVVHVLGAVGRAGVVSLPAGSRVTDALSAAGEAADDADLARLNLARLVVDGERLYVPKVGETELPAALDAAGGGGAGGSSAGVPGAGSGAGAPSDLIDLNTADQTALETLPGIGPALAGRILAWRDEHGRFAAVEDLLDVAGIGDVRFAELQDRVRV